MAQRKRAGPITQRSVDRNYALLDKCFFDDAMYFLKFSLCTVDLSNVASMVQWLNARLPRGRPWFDSRSMQYHMGKNSEIFLLNE